MTSYEIALETHRFLNVAYTFVTTSLNLIFDFVEFISFSSQIFLKTDTNLLWIVVLQLSRAQH